MSNNRKNALSRNRQLVLSKPKYVLVGEYTTKSGQVKNRYKLDETSIPVKVINHKVK